MAKITEKKDKVCNKLQLSFKVIKHKVIIMHSNVQES